MNRKLIKLIISDVILVILMVYFFFIQTSYKKENILPFIVFLTIGFIGLLLLFLHDRKQMNK